MTIRKKLTLLYAGLLAIVVIVFGITVFSVIRLSMIGDIDKTLDETARLIITNSRARVIPGLASGDIRVDLANLDVFRASNVYVQVWQVLGEDTQYAAGSANLGRYDKPLDSAALGSEQFRYTNVTINDTHLRVLTRPIMVARQMVGNVQVAASLETVTEVTNRLLEMLAIASGVALVGVIGLSIWFSHRALKPIEQITEAAAGIAQAEDLGTRLSWKGPNDELGRLVSVFNHMMGRLEHLFSVQQRFVADVSHELRTPLTGIRGNLEIIQRYGVDPDSLEAMDNEARRMSRLVDDLLLLARADCGGVTIDLYPLDLDTVLSEVYQQAKVLAKDQNIQISMEHFEPVRIHGNADRLRQLLLNLVSNALKFTPDGGTIRLSLRQTDAQAVLQVRDTGIGIASQHLDRIFDRFYQVEPSRSHQDERAGTGLGLSIAKWIVEAHDGSITVDSAPGQGTTFTVLLPLLAPEQKPKPPSRPRLSIMGLGRFAPETESQREPERELP